MTAAELERHLVVFSWHGEHYAVPIASVREIIRYTRPTVVATTSELIRGMINLRGRVLPVVDVSSRLGHQLEIDARTRILVLEVANGDIGLIVDTVEGVREIPVSKIEPMPVAGSGDGLGHEIAAIDDQLIVLVDPERALGGVLPGRPGAPPAPPAAAEPAADTEPAAASGAGPDVQALSHPRRTPRPPPTPNPPKP
jgi:purine-binding chemotaxis protein CheW